MRRICRYAVIRKKNVLGYEEYFGPMVSSPQESRRDAERLYGKPGHSLKVIAWATTSSLVKRLCREGQECTP